MCNESDTSPIGGPEPIEARRGREIVKRFAAAVVILIGGFVTFASFVRPTTVRGATRSAKLTWEQRQIQIEQAIARSRSSETNVAAMQLERASGDNTSK